ncbi:hypothetical protein [Methanolobus chelungpuianus]|uniref:Uncharacterized protein n=1 Tax=Methanolobus chelungpuianus TaxID=502115 RepID=A0AAE3HBS8_9EURY|nr:hypothetical protein [Methanolobus chelungpuianus]MCQ6963436.1 hypothetical protein [Methanolobus chelungpuianus]
MKFQRIAGAIVLLFIFFIPLANSAPALDAVDLGPVNEINILSGGSSNLLKSPTAKMAIKYVAPADITLDEVMLLPGCDFPETDQPLWGVQIQTNSGSYPSGTVLGKGTLSNPKDRIWSTVDISPNVALKKGQTYWIVVQYLSGPTPTSTKSWVGFYASKSTDGISGDIYLPYDYNGENKGRNDKVARTNVAYFDGKKWNTDPSERNMPNFVLIFTDGTYHGQPYRHNYAMIYGTNKVGQVFTNYDQEKVITQISMPWNTFHATGSSVRPKDDLYYYICENDYNGKVISSGVFLSADEVYVSGSGTGVFDRRWYTLTLKDPILLEKGKTYFMYFSSPKSTKASRWCTDAGNSLIDVDPALQSILSSATYDGTSSYVVRTSGSWSDAVTDIGRDMSFKFLVYGIENTGDSSDYPGTDNSASSSDSWLRNFVVFLRDFFRAPLE